VPEGDHQLHVSFAGRGESPDRLVAINEPVPKCPVVAVVLEVPEETTEVLEVQAPSAVIEVDHSGLARVWRGEGVLGLFGMFDVLISLGLRESVRVPVLVM
jgi:hypothetical protein